MTNELPLTFERDLYRAVIRFKQEHPGVLEARTQERRRANAELFCGPRREDPCQEADE